MGFRQSEGSKQSSSISTIALHKIANSALADLQDMQIELLMDLHLSIFASFCKSRGASNVMLICQAAVFSEI